LENILKILEFGNNEEKIKLLETLDDTYNTEILEKIIDGYNPQEGRELNSFTELLPTLIIYLVIIIIGLLMVKSSNKESFIKRLETS